MKRITRTPPDIGWETGFPDWEDTAIQSGRFSRALQSLRSLIPGTPNHGHTPSTFKDFQEAVLWNCFCAERSPNVPAEHRDYVKQLNEGADKGIVRLNSLLDFYQEYPEFDEFVGSPEKETPGQNLFTKSRRLLSEIIASAVVHLERKKTEMVRQPGGRFLIQVGPLIYHNSILERTRVPERPACLTVMLTALNRFWTDHGQIPTFKDLVPFPENGRPAYRVVAEFVNVVIDNPEIVYDDSNIKETVTRIAPDVQLTRWPSRRGIRALFKNPAAAFDPYIEFMD